MSFSMKEMVLQVLLAIGVAIVLVFASANTSNLHEQVRKLHVNALREPQMADPALTYLEVVLETGPLAQLSAGFAGIAPSMHMIKLGAARPMSNVDPIEHPARRRYGRVDFSFAFLVFLPIGLIPLAYLIYRKCVQRGSTEKLLSGRSTLFDFIVERVLLPLFASGGYVALVTLACLYAAGTRLGSNEQLGLILLWMLMVALYLLFWLMLFGLFLLQSGSFSSAILKYTGSYLILVFLVPQFIETVSLAVEQPRGRLPLIVERRKLTSMAKRSEPADFDRYVVRQGFKPMDWSTPIPKAQAVALENLRVEESVAPQLKDFEETVTQLDRIAQYTSWLTPFLTAQYGVDDLAGTGVARYSRFRTKAIEFHEVWRKYALGFLARREFLDFDSLRNAPKFKFEEPTFLEHLVESLVRCTYLLALCGGIAILIRRRLRVILPPSRKKAAI